MKKTGCILIILIVVSGFLVRARAQENEIDSLRNLIKKELVDSVKVDLLNSLSRVYFNGNLDTAVLTASQARDLAGSIEYKKGLAFSLKNMGIAYYLQANYIEAVRTCQLAMDVYKEIGDKKGVANMFSNMGASYYNQGDDATALELHLQSLKISEEINDSLRILTSLNNIGGIYQNKKVSYNKALEYFLRSYQLSHAINDLYLMGTSAVNLGEFYYKIGNDSSALPYLREAIKAYSGTENLPYALNYLGRVYTRRQEFAKAISTLSESFEFSKKLDTKLDITQSLVALGQAHAAKGDVDESISSFLKALDYGLPLNATAEVKDAYEGLTAAYSAKGDFNNAYKYQNLLVSIKDKIYNIETDKKLGTLQFTFDMEKKESQITLLNKDKEIQQQVIKREKIVRNSFIGGFGVVLLFASVFLLQRNRIKKAKRRSDELLLNILPEDTAEELKATGTAKAKSFKSVSVLFTDFKNFTQASEMLTPEELVAEINSCYCAFDRIITKYGIEKIKTIGDSYMCAGGLPVTNDTHPYDVICAGLEMAAFVEANKLEKAKQGQPAFDIRIGVHTGPVVAGIVGIKKFSYDIWGDTVNTASRMESSGSIGKVNISDATHELVKDKFDFSYRGKLEAKNKGVIDMYFVNGLKSESTDPRPEMELAHDDCSRPVLSELQ